MTKMFATVSRRCHGAALLAVLSCGLNAAAAATGGSGGDTLQPSWTFAGYGSAGMVHSSETAADFSANALNPGRAGHSQRYAYDVDSRVAGQINLLLDARWSAVV